MEGNNQDLQGLCKEGCGFYGSSANEGFCSQCFKKRLRRWLHMNEPSTPTTPAIVPATIPVSFNLPPSTTPIVAPTTPITTASATTISAPTSSLFNLQRATNSLSTVTTTIVPTTSVTPATIATPTTRAIISSSVDRVECGGEGDEELIICNSNSTQNEVISHDNDASEMKNLGNNPQNNYKIKSKKCGIATNIEESKNNENEASKNDLSDNSLHEFEGSTQKDQTLIPEEERGEGVGAEMSAVLTTVVEDLEEERKMKKRNRCFSCNKKIGLTGFNCRCGGVYCGQHRYSDTHQCSFDYKTLGKLELEKNNPRVAFEKVAKI